MRSSSARCLASNAVVGADDPFSRNENGKKCDRPLLSEAAGAAAGGGGALPVLGSGAGVGSGTLSAHAGTMASAAQIVATRTAVARIAHRPAISFSCWYSSARSGKSGNRFSDKIILQRKIYIRAVATR